MPDLFAIAHESFWNTEFLWPAKKSINNHILFFIQYLAVFIAVQVTISQLKGQTNTCQK